MKRKGSGGRLSALDWWAQVAIAGTLGTVYVLFQITGWRKPLQSSCPQMREVFKAVGQVEESSFGIAGPVVLKLLNRSLPPRPDLSGLHCFKLQAGPRW